MPDIVEMTSLNELPGANEPRGWYRSITGKEAPKVETQVYHFYQESTDSNLWFWQEEGE